MALTGTKVCAVCGNEFKGLGNICKNGYYGHALEDHKRSSIQRLGKLYGKPKYRGRER